MADYFYRVTGKDGHANRFRVRVEPDGDHWVATCDPVDDAGTPTSTSRVAPLFYGIHADQAHRRMLTALENQYDEVAAE